MGVWNCKMFREDVNLTSHGMILLFLLLYLGLVNALNTTCHAGKEIRNDFDWKFSRELTCGDFCVNKTRSDVACLCGKDKLDSENWWNNEFLAIYCCNSGPCYQESIGTNTVIKCQNAKLTNVTEKWAPTKLYRHIPTYSNILQHTPTSSNILQHTPTYFNKPKLYQQA